MKPTWKRLIGGGAAALAVSGAMLLPAVAASSDPIAVAASQLSHGAVYVAPGYNGPKIDNAEITRDIQAGTAQIAIVELPASALAGLTSAQVAQLPQTLRSEGNFSGNVGVVTPGGFNASDPTAANNALAAQRSNGATAVVDAYVKNVQRDNGGPVAGVVHHHYGRIIVLTIVALVVLVIFLLIGLTVWRLRSKTERRADDLNAARRRANTLASQVQEEYNSSPTNPPRIAALLESVRSDIAGAQSVDALDTIMSDLRAALHEFSPSYDATPLPPVARLQSSRGDQADDYRQPRYSGVSSSAQQYAVNRNNQVMAYSGALPYGYRPVPFGYVDSIGGFGTDNMFLDAMIVNELFDANPGGYAGGFDQGFAAGEQQTGNDPWNQPNSNSSDFGGGSWSDTSASDSGGGSWSDNSSADSGGSSWDSSGGSDFGGGSDTSSSDSGGGSW